MKDASTRWERRETVAPVVTSIKGNLEVAIETHITHTLQVQITSIQQSVLRNKSYWVWW